MTSEMQYSFAISAKTSFAKAVLLEPHILVVAFAMHGQLYHEILQDFRTLRPLQHVRIGCTAEDGDRTTGARGFQAESEACTRVFQRLPTIG